MRQRTDSRSGGTPPSPLEKNFREIVVGSGRSQEPYIIAFHYASDNVSGSPLGTLFGFFEVEIHDQDAAYIVNFLASVAKKEYFANPRRSPIESFEAALHKINVALAEIVKHGNISWLGHLHGAIGAVSDNSLNFSVTGEGELYLAREEALQSISVGLAETGNEPHPLKTFTEVSSGSLHDGDLIFALSPSVWSLFSPEDLRRSLNRLGPAGFEQFLRTALVNELPIAAVALLTCSAPVQLKKEDRPKETPRKPAISLGNVWSDTPFVEALQTKNSPEAKAPIAAIETKAEEYTDKKTGHIYVQASPDEAFEENDNPWKERIEMYSHAFGIRLRSWHVSSKKVSRRISKESVLALDALGSKLSAMRRSLARKARSTKRTTESRWQQFREERQRRQASEIAMTTAPQSVREEIRDERAPRETARFTPAPPTPPAPSVTVPSDILPISPPSLERFQEYTMRIRTLSRPLIDQVRSGSRSTLGWLRTRLAALFSWLNGLWQTLSPEQKWSLIGIFAAIIIVSTIALLRAGASTSSETAPPVLESVEPVHPAFPPISEPLATLLSEGRPSFSAQSAKSIDLVRINETVFLITEASIVDLTTKESVPTPEPIRLVAAMDDLDSLFVLSTSDTLYIYSVSTKQFAKNTLPATGKIDQMGAYLTYLYTLDQGTGNISRFPRAEGGFGTPTNWLKETVSLAPEGSMAVYENIALTLKNKEPALFSRGKRANTAFAGTTTLVTTDALAFDQRSGDLLVLDRANKRIVRWSATGTLLAQYFHESLEGAEVISLSPDGTELIVVQLGTTSFWKI